MFSKRAVVACIAALALGGCGGPEAVEEVPPEEFDVSAQKWPPTCANADDPSYDWRFYNVTTGVEVGRHECRCGVLTKYGKETTRTSYQELDEC